MALTDENGGMNTTMLVSPYGNGASSNGSQNGWGGEGWWIILLIVLLAGGWNGGFNGNGGGSNGEVQRGFDQSATMTGIGNLQNGVSGLSTQLCNCCSGMQQTVNSGFANAETAATARQMANMNQAFGNQMAMSQGFNDLGTQFANCCCENRLGIANLGADIAREACADRAAVTDGIRDVITNQTANTQAILDKLCQQELDAERRENQNLRTELNMANLQASQTAQTAEIQRGQVAEIDAMYNRLKDCPVPSQPVYGSQPIFTCNGMNGCGCGCGNNL